MPRGSLSIFPFDKLPSPVNEKYLSNFAYLRKAFTAYYAPDQNLPTKMDFVYLL